MPSDSRCSEQPPKTFAGFEIPGAFNMSPINQHKMKKYMRTAMQFDPGAKAEEETPVEVPNAEDGVNAGNGDTAAAGSEE